MLNERFMYEEVRVLQIINIGLVAAPELPTELANKLANDLPEYLGHQFGSDVSWEIEVVTDALTSVAEDADELINEVHKRRGGKNWNYTICLTDLPIFSENRVVLTDVYLV